MIADARFHRQERRGHHAGESREARSYREHQGVEQPDVHSERAQQFPVRPAGPYPHADPGAFHQQVQEDDDRDPGRGDGQPVGRVGQAGQHRHRPVEERRGRDAPRRRAPDHLHGLVGDQHQRERGQDLVEVVAVVQAPDQAQLDDQAGDRRPGYAGQQGQQVVAGAAPHVRGHERPDHEQRAMGQVDDVHDPEYQREPR